MKAQASAAVMALAAFQLASCAKPPPPRDLASVTAGFDAFKAGDRAGLERQIQALGQGLPDDRTSGVFVACSEEGYALRRQARAKQELEVLDQPPAISLSDGARYVYFQFLIAGGDAKAGRFGDVGGPTDFECERDPTYDQSHQMDDAEHFAIRDAGRDRLRAWFTALRTSLGDQFDAQMQDAARQLHNNRLSVIDRWEAPNSI